MKRFLKTYHSLPAPIWPLAASLQALLLKRRRYGALFREELPRIRERTFWERHRWQEFQRVQLAEQLDRAAHAIPAYRGNPGVGGNDALEVLAKWPLLDVEDFRHEADRYRDPEYGFGKIITLYTSGSTGTPKKIIRDARAEQLNYAYTEARWRNTAGVKLGDRWVMIGGQLGVPVERKPPPFWVAAYPMGQMYMSSYHLQPAFAGDYLRAIRAWKPAYIIGYASSLNMLAEFSEQTGIGLDLKCILSNAEPLYRHVRERLQRVFGCKVYDTYGATEGAFMGFECQAGNMHISPDFGVFEILRDDGTPCAPGEIGRVVVTGLTNRAMPLIRYPNGDLAAWAENQECTCGCSFPILQSIEGRSDDMLQLPNGRQIGRLDPVFKAELPIREAQIAQTGKDAIEVRIVPEAGKDGSGSLWNEGHNTQLMNELRARIGPDVSIRIRLVEGIVRGNNNKFKAVVREF